MRIIGFKYLMTLFVFGFFFSVTSMARPNSGKTFFVLDFDGTVIYDRDERAAFRSQIQLERVHALHSVLQSDPSQSITAPIYSGDGKPSKSNVELNLPMQVFVSYAEFDRLKTRLALADGQLRDPQAHPLDKDPLFPEKLSYLVPGYYRLGDASYHRYRQHPDFINSGASFLMDDWEMAKKRMKASKEPLRLFGDAYPLLFTATASAETVTNLIINTVRGEHEGAFYNLFDAWKKEGLILASRAKTKRRKGSPLNDRPHIYNLSAYSGLQLDRDLWRRKIEVPIAVAHQAARVVGEHNIVVADDLNEVIVEVVKTFEQMAQKHLFRHLKFYVFHSGSSDDIAAMPHGMRHRILIVQRNSTGVVEVRPPLKNEKLPWMDAKEISKKLSKRNKCLLEGL